MLWPSLQRDFLLSLAAEGIYRPLWSSAILSELQYGEAAKLASRDVPSQDAEARAAFLIDQMRHAFDDAEVQGWEGLEGTYGLPDLNDEHVVAAAVVGGAGAIVTVNLKDFPPNKMPAGLEVMEPDDFAANTVALDPSRAAKAIRQIARRSGTKGPAVSPAELLDLLAQRYGFHIAVELIRGAS